MKVQLIRTLKNVDNEKTGIGYYSDFLQTELKEMGHDVESISSYFDNMGQGFRGLIVDNSIKPIIAIIKGRKNTDIVHAISELHALFLPFTKAKRVLTFHHVIKKDEVSKLWGLLWRLSVLIAKSFVDEFIAISPLTKKDMVEKLNIPEEKITVAMHPPKSNMFKEDIPKENTVLFVGILIKRKNPEAGLLVFKEMLERPIFQDFKLIMCGAGSCREELDEVILEMNLSDSVKIVSDLSVEELRNLYNVSRFLLNTSNFEGLGITTLEAQMCGTPVLYFEDADLPPEVMVEAIPCVDVSDMVKKAAELLEDSNRMAEVIDRGVEFSNGFGKDYKEKIAEVYNKK